jgi:hypothetical protein
VPPTSALGKTLGYTIGQWLRSVRGRTPISFTLAQSCRANGVAPLAYFEHLYERLPLATTAAELEALLPWNVKALLKAATAGAYSGTQ